MKDRRALVFLAALLALMVGGAIFIRADNSSSAEEAPSAETTQASAAPSTATTAITPQTKEDFDAAVRRITDIENELFSKPDPDRVGQIMDPDCSCYGQTRGTLNNLVKNGWHVKAANLVVETTSVYEIKGDRIEGVVDISTKSNPAVDKSGNPVENPPTPSRQPLVYELKKGQDGVWRIYDRHLPEEVF